VRGFYKGMASPLVGNAPIQAAVFTAYGDMSRRLLKIWPDRDTRTEGYQPNFRVVTMAGVWAGFAQSIVMSPVELVKCKLQVQIANGGKGMYKGPWDVARKTLQTSGVMGLSRGLVATTLRDCPSFGAYFFCYEYTKYFFWPEAEKHNPNYQSSTPVLLLAGGLAGVATWGSTYPFDVCKTIIQTTPEHEKAPTIRAIFKAHPPSFFLRGLIPTLIRAVPANSVTFLVYDRTLGWLNSGAEEKQGRA
jgi:solute carrier family 25 carnitine/acylcarnitine transporter 20/29